MNFLENTWKDILLVGKLVDSINNILSMMLFSRKRYEYDYISKYATQEAYVRQKLQFSILYIEVANALYLMMMNAACLVYLIYLYKVNYITVGDIAFILVIMTKLAETIQNIARDFFRFLDNFGKCSQTLTLIESLYAIIESKSAKPLKITDGSIRFENICFGYDRHPLLFDHLSIEIPGGQKIVLFGSSGSGKTTFVELILRFFYITSGDILIDNQSIQKVTQDSLHEAISFIPQEPILFNRTIYENIIYGNINLSFEEIIWAAKQALAHEFIETFPEGYQTIVGERGKALSGGQRQRIAIARAILKDSKILIFDEITSNLDHISKNILKQNIKKFSYNKTIITISHRLEDVINAERVLLFSKGRVIADGSHNELIVNNSNYQNLFNSSNYVRWFYI